MKRIDRLVPWFVGVFVVTAMLAAIYLTAQHNERSGADDAALGHLRAGRDFA